MQPLYNIRGVRVSYAILSCWVLLLVAFFVVEDWIAPAGRRLAKVTGDDPPVYFDVSHALLFHRTFDLAPEFQRVKPEDDLWTPISKVTGHQTSPFPIGYSIMAMPFLATGTVLDAIAGNPADGFSHFAILFYCLTNVILTGLGLVALFTVLHDVAALWNGISPAEANIAALTVTCAIFFGTNVGYYAFSQMSHAATFLAGSAFLAWWWRVRKRTDVRSWAILGLLAGLLSISRWQDIFFAGAPLLFDLMSGWQAIRHRIWSRMTYGAVIAMCWIPQVMQWKFMFGKYLTVPQGSSIFVFPPPFVPKLLFSSEHGWFTWTPLALIGLVGLIAAAVKAPRLFAPWILVIALEVSLIASIPHAWHSGPSFGNRYMTSSAPLIGLGLLYLLCRTTRPVRRVVISATALCCLFAVMFAVQFRMDLIPKLDRLTAAELFTDKFRMPQVRRQKLAALRADELISGGTPQEAIRILQAAAEPPDRDVLEVLRRAYQATGQRTEAQDADRRLRELLATRLF